MKSTKKVVLINQNKGGVGKSFLTALIIAKELKEGSKFLVLDCDSANQSTMRRFAENKEVAKHIRPFSIIEEDTIQQTAFNELFNNISTSNANPVYIDLGGTESREILAFFRMIGIDHIIESLEELNIDLEMWTVINPNDSATTQHLNNVIDTLENKRPIKIYVNGSENQNSDSPVLQQYKAEGYEVNIFGSVKDARAKQFMSDYVLSGFSSSLGMLKGLWVGMVENLKK